MSYGPERLRSDDNDIGEEDGMVLDTLNVGGLVYERLGISGGLREDVAVQSSSGQFVLRALWPHRIYGCICLGQNFRS